MLSEREKREIEFVNSISLEDPKYKNMSDEEWENLMIEITGVKLVSLN
jgi:hypothetical protein